MASGCGLEKSGRINGWKAIGAYFGRDRTTAIRWSKDRGLPVHRLPGGKTATVYALKSELDDWAKGQPAEADAVVQLAEATTETLSEPAPAAIPATGGKGRGRLWVGGGLIALILAVGAVLYLPKRLAGPQVAATPVSQTVTLPADPDLAQSYMRASDLVAERTAGGLEEAITLYRDINRREPGYAPAYAGLAEALLLSREFGMRRDAEVFPQARTAARTAVRLAPNLASAHRALGFVAYWSDHDRAAAGAAFRRAIELDPTQGLTRFWYGNILADNGDVEPARAELERARLKMPGSVAVQTDFAWALWAAGDEAAARPMLESLAARHPDFAVVHDCLAIVRLAEGDYDGYARSLARFAAMREDPVLLNYSAALDVARADGPEAMRRVMMDRALEDLEDDGNVTRAWAAFLASTAGDRAGLVGILRTADGRREVWGDAGLVLRIKERWTGDREIQDLLGRRAGPRIA